MLMVALFGGVRPSQSREFEALVLEHDRLAVPQESMRQPWTIA
jgi:hypothetical protein